MNRFSGFARPVAPQRECGPDRSVPAEVETLSREHGALLRQIGGLQQRVSAQLQTGARALRQMESENLRLRGELVILRTAVAWDLGRAALARPAQPRRPLPTTASDPALEAAQRVICQTGCVGHAHPWLADDGQCRRSGQACDRVDPPVSSAVASDRAGHPVVTQEPMPVTRTCP